MELDHLFVVGSPRSGTTWLQLLLAQHEEVATGKETQLFTHYVKRLSDRWQEELREAEVATTNGLTRVLSPEEFQDAIRAFCDQVFSKLRENRPDARFVLEKSPEHSLHAQEILNAYPSSWFLHIIRDPRAVSNSFRHAAVKWWTWAPSGPIETTRRWRSNVLAGEAISTLTPRYKEVRYEDLVERGDQTLLEIFEWMGLDADLAFCRAALAACEIEKLKEGSRGAPQPWKTGEEPEGFFRSGEKDSWRAEMAPRAIAIVEYEARDLIRELGYESVTRGADRRRAPTMVVVHDLLARVRLFGRRGYRALDRRFRRVLSRM